MFDRAGKARAGLESVATYIRNQKHSHQTAVSMDTFQLCHRFMRLALISKPQ